MSKRKVARADIWTLKTFDTNEVLDFDTDEKIDYQCDNCKRKGNKNKSYSETSLHQFYDAISEVRLVILCLRCLSLFRDSISEYISDTTTKRNN